MAPQSLDHQNEQQSERPTNRDTIVETEPNPASYLSPRAKTNNNDNKKETIKSHLEHNTSILASAIPKTVSVTLDSSYQELDDDDDLSSCSPRYLISQAQKRLCLPVTTTAYDSDDGISYDFSIHSVRQKKLDDLQSRLHTSETTKVEVLQQLSDVMNEVHKQKEVEEARLKFYQRQYLLLKEDNATRERDFMNEVNILVHDMAEKDRKHVGELEMRDDRIAELERELEMLKLSRGDI